MNATEQADTATPSSPLNSSSLVQSAQLAIFLGVMWSSIVCAGTGVWLAYGETLVLQTLLSLGVLMTGLILSRASCAITWREIAVKHAVQARGASWRAQR